ncbi:prenyltransferase [Paenibacillus sp. J2TS4]|uniref:prenyltransferase n=1 Tax=Paenibacillus sp. J2TS4 TaxID=2807194 RepID=UPI001B029AFC|nr:prenyltransferase [Paenibacillus sp. J2TS4]GIP35701.1 1,4-dihydroxy-2-naphthoate octaprenyltransferase [Paenibacillus sp. J2TS4]
MSRAKLFLKASRFQVVPVMIVPVLIGGIGAYAWNGVFDWTWFAVTLIGAVALHLFSNMINDLWDYRNGADIAAHSETGTISTNSGMLTSGEWSERTFARLTWSLFAFSLICGILLIFFRGGMVAVYGGIGALLAYFYVAPPIRYGYRGKGFSEVSIFISFGILPVLGSHYVQALQFDSRALLASLPIGGLTTLILFNHHFLHWQADKLAGKNTLVVILGERGAQKVSLAIFGAAYAMLLLAVALGALPVYSLIALITANPVLKAYKQLQEHNPAAAYAPLMKASLSASVNTGLIISASLGLHGFLQ